MNVEQLLTEAVQVLTQHFPHEEAQLDAKVLLSFVLKLPSHTHIYLHVMQEISEEDKNLYLTYILRRAHYEPIAYITQEQNFFGYSFFVSPQVLIPRPETEVLVETVLPFQNKQALLVDLGTGSGNIPITLAKEGVWKKVYGLEISEGALTCAAQNANNLQAPVDVVHMDVCVSAYTTWLRTTVETIAPTSICITANLPYIAEGEKKSMSQEVTSFEPHSALFGGASGDEILIAATKRTMEALSDFAGPIMMIHEIDDTHSAHLVQKLSAITSPYIWQIRRDNEGKERFLLLEKEKTVL